MIRLIIIAIFLVLYFLLSIIPFGILWVIGKFNMDWRNRISRRIVQGGFWIVIFLSGVKLDVSGKENIPTDTAVLYVGNHRGFFDIVTGYTQLPGPTGYVSKKEIRKVPFLRVWMHYINCLWLDRENLREGVKTILAGVEQLKSGVSVFVYPEGTRSKDGQLLEFKEGAMKMALKANVPIMPVAFFGTSRIFEDQFPKVRKGTVTIHFGKPIYPDQLEKADQKRLGAYTRDVIAQMLEEGPEV